MEVQLKTSLVTFKMAGGLLLLLLAMAGCSTPRAARETAGLAATNLTQLTGSLAEVGRRQDRLLRFLDLQLSQSAARIDTNLTEHAHGIMEAAGRTNAARFLLSLTRESDAIADQIAAAAAPASNAVESDLGRQRKETQEALGKVQKALLTLSSKEGFDVQLKFLLDYGAKVAESYDAKQKEAEKLAGSATAATNAAAGGKK